MWQHLSFGWKYIFYQHAFSLDEEEKKVTGMLNQEEKGGCSRKKSICSFKNNVIVPALWLKALSCDKKYHR